MTFGEHIPPRPVSVCWILVSNCKFGDRDDIFIVKLNPPVRYKGECECEIELDKVAIASRTTRSDIESKTDWPIDVYVLKLKSEINPISKEIALDDAELILWAELHDSMESAQRFLEKQSPTPPPTVHPDRVPILTRIWSLLKQIF